MFLLHKKVPPLISSIMLKNILVKKCTWVKILSNYGYTSGFHVKLCLLCLPVKPCLQAWLRQRWQDGCGMVQEKKIFDLIPKVFAKIEVDFCLVFYIWHILEDLLDLFFSWFKGVSIVCNYASKNNAKVAAPLSWYL